MTLEIITDREGFAALEEPWNALAARFANPLLRHEYFAAVAGTFWAQARIAVYVLRTGGSIRGIAPFRAVRYGGVPRLELLSNRFGEPAGLLYGDGEALHDLLAALVGSPRTVILNRFPDDGPEMRVLRSLLPPNPRCLVRSGDSTVAVPTDKRWPDLEAGMSSSQRAYVRRQRRRAERFGTVTFEVVAPDEGNVEALLGEVYRTEFASWKGRNGTAILSTPIQEAFFTGYGRALARQGALRLFFLRINGEAAAVRYAIEHAGRLWELKIGYDERWHECSPGVLLTHETLRYCCERGLAAHEFLGREDRWQHMWPHTVQRYSSPRVHPRSIRGGISLVQDLCYFATQKMLRSLQLDADGRKARAKREVALTKAVA